MSWKKDIWGQVACRSKGHAYIWCFKAQITNKVTKFIEENNCVIVLVPNDMTDQFQPLDLSVNGQVKEFLKGKFECWYAQQIANQFEGGSSMCGAQGSLKLLVIKPIRAKWLSGLYDYLGNNSGFRHHHQWVRNGWSWRCWWWNYHWRIPFGGETERWAIILSGLDSFLTFPNLLKS